MNRMARRVAALERAARPLAHPPAFLLAADNADVDRQVARVRADHPGSNWTVFVMIAADRRS
jgi:hypothetical protein